MTFFCVSAIIATLASGITAAPFQEAAGMIIVPFEKSISSIERTVVKKFIHYSSYFDLIFNIGMIPFIYWLYVIWIKKETSLLNIYVFIKKYSRISGDLLSFALFFVIFICCDIIHIVLTMKKKQLNIMDSVVVMSIMVKLFLILILMAFLTAGILM